MNAITGNYKAPNKGIDNWVLDWIYRSQYWTSPRKFLAEQLRYIRKNHSRYEAKEFSDYLLWIGVYPIKRRNYRV